MSGADIPVPKPRRVSPRLVAIVFAVFFATLAAGYLFLLQPAYVPAFTGLRPADAAALTAQLDTKAVPYRFADGGTSVLVPEAQADAARVAVAASDISLHGGVGLELFNKSDMGLTDFAQKINYQRATQGELERTIMMIDGIERARVHLAIPERSIFRADRASPKAAVELTTRPGALVDAIRIAGIQRLVANAVPDLLPTDVVIIDATGRELSTTPDAAAATDPIGEEQQALQHYYRARVRAALTIALPSLHVSISVMALPDAAAADAAAPSTVSNARTFGLRVTLATAAPLAADDKQRAQAAVETAIAFDPVLGDTVSFAVGSRDPGYGAVPSGTAFARVAPPPIADPTGSSAPWMGWPLLAAAVALIAVAALMWRWRARGERSLTPAERQSLIERLRHAMATGEDRHAA